MGVTVDGQTEATQAVGLLVDDLDDLESGYAEIARYAAAAAAAHVHSRSYRLARSLRGTSAAGQAMVTSALIYAGPQNYGWPRRGIRPQRFVEQADAEVETKAVSILQRETDQAIQRRGLS